jgi:hypothetical protein
MKRSCFLLLVGLSVAVLPARAQTGDAPRELGAPPSMPAPTRAQPPVPRQLSTAPGGAGARPDSAGRMAPAPAAGYGTSRVAGAEGSLPGLGSQRQPRYQVGLKNGQLFTAADITQKSPLFGHPFLLLDGRQRVELAEVRFYEDETGHYVRTALPGSNRETTLRRDKTGRISLYSITSTQYNPGGYGMGGYGMGSFGMPYGGYHTVKTEYFSKDNGPIQNLTQRNLALATVDNSGSQALLANAARYQTFIVSSYVVGGGLLVAGFVQSLRAGNENRSFSPLVFAAIPVLVVPLVLKSKRDQAQKQAIALYNSQ